MSEHTIGPIRNCRHCQRQVYFGGIYWWHSYSDSTSCSPSDPSDPREADPEMDETERVRAAAPELLEALRLAKAEIQKSGNWVARDYGWPDVRKAIDAAIAKATRTT